MVRLRFFLLCIGLIGAVLPGPAMAGETIDTTKPVLRLSRDATFVPGSTIGEMTPDPNDGTPLATSEIQMTTAWSATDASGICGYRTRATYAGYADPWSAWSDVTSATFSTTDYNDQQGGGTFKFLGLRVQARDCEGNSTRRSVSFTPLVYQENGESYGYGTLGTEYQGRWATSYCACWSGGTTRKAYQAGASATFTLNPWQVSGVARHPIAVIMERAPDRGQVGVYVDGVQRAVVDTASATKVHRSVVWAGRVRVGEHTLALVNLGTPGRSRIDVDAIVVSR